MHLSFVPGLLLTLISDFQNWSFAHSVLFAERLFVAICMLSILLRWPIARYLAGAGVLVMAIFPVLRLVWAFPPESRNAVDYFLALGICILLFVLGVYLVRSARVREFLYPAPNG